MILFAVVLSQYNRVTDGQQMTFHDNSENLQCNCTVPLKNKLQLKLNFVIVHMFINFRKMANFNSRPKSDGLVGVNVCSHYYYSLLYGASILGRAFLNVN